MSVAETNPLLDFSGLPRFPEIEAGHVGTDVDRLLAESRVLVAAVSGDQVTATWTAFVLPPAKASAAHTRPLGRGTPRHNVLTTPQQRSGST